MKNRVDAGGDPEKQWPTPAAWPPYWESIAESIQRCWKTSDWGRYQSEIRDELCAHLLFMTGTKTLRFMPSGSAAVEWSLRIAGLGANAPSDPTRQDRVILAAYDYPGNFRAIEIVGARPMLIDIESGRPTIDLDQLETIPAESAKAVIVSHLYGIATDMPRLRQICNERGWMLIEDVCQTPGMKIDNHPAGSFGDLSTLSFGGSKPLTSGAGGAIVTSSDRLAAKMRSMLDRPSDSTTIAPLAAAALLPQVKSLDEMIAKRQSSIPRITALLPAEAKPIIGRKNDSPSYYKLAIEFDQPDQRNTWMQEMQTAGLPVGEPFRAMDRINQRRADRFGDLENAKSFAGHVALIDHRMLMSQFES